MRSIFIISFWYSLITAVIQRLTSIKVYSPKESWIIVHCTTVCKHVMRKKCLYSKIFWSVFSRKYLSVFSANAGEYEPQNSEYGHLLRSDIHTSITSIPEKSVCIWSFFGPYFPASISSYSFQMRENTDHKTPNTNTYYTVICIPLNMDFIHFREKYMKK